nr:MAG TPA: hypothetical protein [Caudoviricetes sp.]
MQTTENRLIARLFLIYDFCIVSSTACAPRRERTM